MKAGYESAIKKAGEQIAIELGKLSGTIGEVEFANTVLYVLYKEWGENFTAEQAEVVKRFATDAYKTFRQSPEALKSAMSDFPAPALAALDFRVIDYYRRFDTFYLGKFITDTDTRKAIFQWIKEKYAGNGFTVTEANLADFKKTFPDLLAKEDWKIDRILRTSVNRMRNTANLAYMNQAGVANFEIVGLRDSKQCAYCSRLYGMKFSVATGIQQIEGLTGGTASQIKSAAPFVTYVFKKAEDLDGLSSSELQRQGIGTPPFHGNCRCSIIAVL